MEVLFFIMDICMDQEAIPGDGTVWTFLPGSRFGKLMARDQLPLQMGCFTFSMKGVDL